MANQASYENNTLMAFIDILGFTERVKHKSLGDLIQLLNDFMAHDNSSAYQGMKQINTKFVSDSLVVWITLNGEKDVNAFFVYIGSLVAKIHKQGNMIVRGCIAYGAHYNNEVLWISPVFIDAYQGEQRAKMPRIILSEEAQSAIEKISPKFVDGLWVEIDQEGVCFLNYMNMISGAYTPNDTNITLALNHKELPSSLLRHKEIIENSLKDYPDHLEKYEWLADMHNRYVTTNVNLPDKENFFVVALE